VTWRAAMTAGRGAAGAIGWARPRAGLARSWMAARAARGSVAVQESLAPRISSALASAARRLDPSGTRSSRLPRVLAGTALLAAGVAAATAMAVRSRARGLAAAAAPRSAGRPGAGQGDGEPAGQPAGGGARLAPGRPGGPGSTPGA